MKTRIVEWETPGLHQDRLEGHRRYGLLVEEIEVDGFHCESYGVVITDELTGEEARCRHVTVSATEAIEFLNTLVRNGVSLVTLQDVVEDWLAR